MNKLLTFLKVYWIAILLTIPLIALIVTVIAINEAYHVPALLMVIVLVWAFAWVMNKDFPLPDQEALPVKKDDED